MGMYTQLLMGGELKVKQHSREGEWLNAFLNGEDVEPLNSHPFFCRYRWRQIPCGGSYYFPHPSFCSCHWDEISQTYRFLISSSLKNYDQEIEFFIVFIRDFMEADEEDVLGYYLYEEDSDPAIIRGPEGGRY